MTRDVTTRSPTDRRDGPKNCPGVLVLVIIKFRLFRAKSRCDVQCDSMIMSRVAPAPESQCQLDSDQLETVTAPRGQLENSRGPSGGNRIRPFLFKLHRGPAARPGRGSDSELGRPSEGTEPDSPGAGFKNHSHWQGVRVSPGRARAWGLGREASETLARARPA